MSGIDERPRLPRKCFGKCNYVRFDIGRCYRCKFAWECKTVTGEKPIGVVDSFVYNGRYCVVYRSHLGYHNGYVEVAPYNRGRDYGDFVYDIETDELTFSGSLSTAPVPHDAWFFGFDSAHAWNVERPETQSFESVRDRTIRMADEMIAKGI